MWHWRQVRAEVKSCNVKNTVVEVGRSWRECKSTEGLFYPESPVIAHAEGAVSILTLGCALVYFLIFIVGKNQTDPCSVLAVWKCLQQPVQGTEDGNSKKP